MRGLFQVHYPRLANHFWQTILILVRQKLMNKLALLYSLIPVILL